MKIANGNTSVLTTSDKAFIEKQSAAYGLEFHPESTLCESCYADQAVIILCTARKQDGEEDQSERKYVLRDGIDVVWKGVRINAELIDDKRAAELIARGFKKKFFAVCPD